MYFESLPYRVHEDTGLINYDQLEIMARAYRPKLIVGGGSAYPREFDYVRMRSICNSVGAYFMYDMAHTSGMVAAGFLNNPFDYADIVTTTTHKSLRGPRGAMIFYRKGTRTDNKGKEAPYELATKIDNAVFPGHQGGPHNHTIAALAVALKQATGEEFRTYQEQVLVNAQALAKALLARGFNLVTGGTDNHLMLVDLRNQDIDGARLEKVLEQASIAANKNTIPSDKSAFVPMGLRLGTPAMTSRGFEETDFERVAEFLLRGTEIAKKIKAGTQGKKLSDFVERLNSQKWPEVETLRKEVEAFATNFPTIA